MAPVAVVFAAEDLHRQLRQTLVLLGPVQLRAGPFRSGDAGLDQSRQRAVVRQLQGLQLDPLLCNAIPDDRIVHGALLRQSDQLLDLRVERSGEGEAQRAALVQQRRHRNLPAPADLAEQVLARNLDATEEDLVELDLTLDLP